MSRPVRLPAALLAGFLVVLAACDQQPTEPAAPSASPAPSATVLQQARGGTPDQHALARAVPAFGGLYLENGVPVVYLTDPAQRGAIARELAGFMAARGISPSELRVKKGRFSYTQLESFFDRARPDVFAGPGGVFADLDEAANRVTLGVEDGAAAARVRAGVASLGLPDGAVEVVITPPILPMQQTPTLRDVFDPIPAGVQIHFGNYLCSIGIIAQYSGQPHFVTASHCTNRQGGVEGTEYYQPLSTQSEVIGIEVKDPEYFTFKQDPNCYRGAKCRYSDAALVARTPATTNRDFALGIIAQAGLRSIQVTGSGFVVTGKESGNGLEGASRAKVGRTTGFTTGTVTGTCVDTGVSGSNIVLLCQDWVTATGSEAIVGSGDSGSDVFEITSGTNVTWWGILWGGSSDGSTFIYSPASNVQRELGTLDVTGSGGGGGTSVLSASFSYSCHFGDCTFDASSSTGAETYDWAFGDGRTGTGVTTSHTYDGDGTYQVTLTVTATGSSDQTASQSIACQTKGPHLQCK